MRAQVFLTLCLTGAITVPAFAQSAEQQLREQLRKTVTDLRALQDENADLKSKLAAATAAAPPAAKPADSEELKQLKSQLSRKSADAAKQVEKAGKELADKQKAYDDATELARKRDGDAKHYEELYRHVSDYVSGCARKNAMLIEISEQLIERYKKKDLWDAAFAEPLTGVHQVTFEHIAQDYHAKVVEATCAPPDLTPTESAR